MRNLRTASLVACVLLALSCSQTPEPQVLRTFERAQKISTVCLKLYNKDAAGTSVPILPEAAPLNDCSPTPRNLVNSAGVLVDDGSMTHHLFGLVTQTARGEIAVVDLTAGRIIDPDPSTPGVNFLAVGAIPAGIASMSDGRMTFVATREVNKPALFGIDSKLLMGHAGANQAVHTPITNLGTWPVCALPESPVDVHVTKNEAGESEIVVVLAGSLRQPSRVLTLDPAPFLRGAGIDTTVGPNIGPGSMAPCPVRSVVELSSSLPASSTKGAEWQSGLPQSPGVVTELPSLSSVCTSITEPTSLPLPKPTEGGALARASASIDSWMVVSDGNQPVLHVYEHTSSGLISRGFLLATSEADPSRKVTVGAVAISPLTREFRRFVYAVDEYDGSVMVFDLTKLAESGQAQAPLRRPYAEVNPLSPRDRIVFPAPAVSVSFVRHDFAAKVPGSTAFVSGALCNPNPKAGSGEGPFTDPGASYRANLSSSLETETALGPLRLRGIFGFVALTNGLVSTVDVDDWDAPCRRPDPMDVATSSLSPALPQSDSSNAYGAPVTWEAGPVLTVSQEAFFPVAPPHRLRSTNLLRKDPLTGVHIPYLAGSPQLSSNDAPIALAGLAGLRSPYMTATSTKYPDPSNVKNPTDADPATRTLLADPTSLLFPPTEGTETTQPGVRFSFEDPTAHIDQDWKASFEGAIRENDGLTTTVRTDDDFQTLVLSQTETNFCSAGIEDLRIGRAKSSAILQEAAAKSLSVSRDLASKLADYVQITDELLPEGDPYWSESVQGCWDEKFTTPTARREACVNEFREAADQSLSRDFPILEASKDKLVVGRFGYPDGNRSSIQGRIAVSKDPSNAPFMKALQCCFHSQARFRIRAGSQWVVTGSASGFLHRVRTDDSGACVLSCRPEDQLLNGRTPAISRITDRAVERIPGRDSALAFRNPMFSFVAWNGIQKEGATFLDVAPTRGLTWKFSTRGQFTPLSVNLAGSSGALVSPQSVSWVPALGQLAIVDGGAQGLIMLNLATIASAHAPYN